MLIILKIFQNFEEKIKKELAILTVLTSDKFNKLQMCSEFLQVIDSKIMIEPSSKDIVVLLELQRHLLECMISLVDDNE